MASINSEYDPAHSWTVARGRTVTIGLWGTTATGHSGLGAIHEWRMSEQQYESLLTLLVAIQEIPQP